MDWTFWWNWIPESPKQRDEIDRLDVVGRNKTWKVQTDAPERADWTLEAETGLEKSKPTHQRSGNLKVDTNPIIVDIIYI